MKILMAWVGTQDRDAPTHPGGHTGPICSAVEARSFDRLVLIENYGDERVAEYVDWLRQRTSADVHLKSVSLADPTDIGAIHRITADIIEECREEASEVLELTFHLSPGTWAMSYVWAILAGTRYPAELIQSSVEAGVKTVDVPFEVSAELLPKIMAPADARLSKLSGNPTIQSFGDLEFRSAAMGRLVSKAKKAAMRNVPILIEGETGTEKTVLARAIHEFGPRSKKPFVAINLGSVNWNTIDSQLFGDPGLVSEVGGALKQASGGTLYLEEVELLPPAAQIRLQAFIDDMANNLVAKYSTTTPDVRIIAATRKPLIEAVATGAFREELFYGLAVLVLKIPPLRERQGGMGPLIDTLLERINDESAGEPGFEKKTLTPSAKNVLLQRPWPGNIRELENSLRRAVVWGETNQITDEDVWDAVFSSPTPAVPKSGILSKPIDEGVDLQKIMAEVAQHYITQAIEHAEGNKTTAAKLVGLPSYQTLSNWMKKYDVV